MAEQVDVAVIGMGPGGEDVAGALAEAGMSVVGVESKLVGGECPYWACVPSKMMVRAAGLLTEGRRIDHIAGTSDVRADWAPVAARIRDEATDDWNDRVAVERFESKGGRLVRGRGRIVEEGVVDVEGSRFVASRGIVIATGSQPVVPAIPGLEGTPFWTNREATEAKDLPRSIVVLGGGTIGVEMGQVFRRFGCEVTLVEPSERLMKNEEPEAGQLVREVFEREGIEVITGSRGVQVDYDSGSFTVRLSDGRLVSAEQLLVATGRRVDLASIGVDNIGIDPEAGFLAVDEHLRVRANVWAVGDVTGKGAFTHIAMYQSRIATADILGAPHAPATYHAVPRVTFTDPEVGSVGLSESAAREQFPNVRVGTSQVSSSTRGWIHKIGNEGFIKLIEDADRGVLVGATSAGPVGGEVLSVLTLAVHEATQVERLREMIYPYPTFHRGIEEALKNLGSM